MEELGNASAGLEEACARWQSGRDGGSSLLRGAARVLTGVPHYFQAGFIADYEEKARSDEQGTACAKTLLAAVAASEHRDPDGWAEVLEVPAGGFCGRGLSAKPDQDPQIERQLAAGWIDMPLWGVSLSRRVADSYGTRFLLQLVGPFPAVPSWRHSQIKSEELELITGGHYVVVDIERPVPSQARVLIRWDGPLPVSDLIRKAD